MALPKRWEMLVISGLETGWAGKPITYGGPCGPDTVEHVGSQGDGDEEIFGVADAHYVAWFFLGEPIGAGVYTEFSVVSSFEYDRLDQTYT